MTRGRKPNHDKRIAELVSQLKDAIFARERAALEARIETQVGSLIGSVRATRSGNSVSVTVVKSARPGRGNRKPRSAASRRAQSLKMKKYWAERRKAAGKS